MSFKFQLRLFFFFILSLWMILIFHEFIFPAKSIFSIIGIYVDKSTSLICHQEPGKLLSLGNMHSSVCARCSGIYSGAFAASMLLLIDIHPRINNKHLFLSLILLSLDVFLVNAGVYNYLKTTAYISGIILGCVSFFYLYESVLNLLSQRKTGHNT
jgi:uncharacterized membrane protein